MKNERMKGKLQVYLSSSALPGWGFPSLGILTLFGLMVINSLIQLKAKGDQEYLV